MSKDGALRTRASATVPSHSTAVYSRRKCDPRRRVGTIIIVIRDSRSCQQECRLLATRTERVREDERQATITPRTQIQHPGARREPKPVTEDTPASARVKSASCIVEAQTAIEKSAMRSYLSLSPFPGIPSLGPFPFALH